MRILFVSHNRYGLNVGGLQRQIARTKEALEELGHEVVLWDPWVGINAREYDLAHFFSTDSSLLAVLRACEEMALPTVLSPVLGSGRDSPSKIMVRRWAAMSRIPVYQDLQRGIALVRSAGVVVALHSREARLCRTYGRGGPIVQIPNGVDSVFRRGDRARGRRLAQSDRYVLHVGQFWPNKGQKWLIENTPQTLDLRFIGSVPKGNHSYYQACLAAASGRRARFLGAFEPDSQSLADLYAGAACLVINSTSEVAPIVVNEALAAGTRVLMPRHLSYDREKLPHETFEFGDAADYRRGLALSIGAEGVGEVHVPTWQEVAALVEDAYALLFRDARS